MGVIVLEEEKGLYEKGISFISEIGVIGDPTQSNIEKGKIFIEKLAEKLTDDIKKILIHIKYLS
ncbi:MAG: hypothetical protein ACFFDB_02890 [Promethearchaeota archaeon]